MAQHEGASQRAVLEAGGWKSEQMVRRYAHLSAEHLLRTTQLLDAVLQHKNSTQPSPGQVPRPLQLLEVLVGRVGIEPTTNGLRVRCSTS